MIRTNILIIPFLVLGCLASSASVCFGVIAWDSYGVASQHTKTNNSQSLYFLRLQRKYSKALHGRTKHHLKKCRTLAIKLARLGIPLPVDSTPTTPTSARPKTPSPADPSSPKSFFGAACTHKWPMVEPYGPTQSTQNCSLLTSGLKAPQASDLYGYDALTRTSRKAPAKPKKPAFNEVYLEPMPGDDVEERVKEIAALPIKAFNALTNTVVIVPPRVNLRQHPHHASGMSVNGRPWLE